MTKRKFLKAVVSAAGGRLLAPMMPLLAEGALTNWSGNVTYSTDDIRHPANIDEIRAVLRAEPKLKVLGTRHCFNAIADSRHCLLMLDRMKDIRLDLQSGTVTLGAAVKYGELGPYLDTRGFALHNLASLPHISVAGACTTATHGSGQKNGNLSTAVSSLELVTASGDIVHLNQGDSDFKGAVVGLGALGVITRMSLKVQPTFQVRQYVYQNLPLAEMQNHFDEIEASGYSVSLFTNWRDKNIS